MMMFRSYSWENLGSLSIMKSGCAKSGPQMAAQSGIEKYLLGV